MTAEERCRVVKDVYASLTTAKENTAIYMEEMMYFVRNNDGQIVLIKARSEKDAINMANKE